MISNGTNWWSAWWKWPGITMSVASPVCGSGGNFSSPVGWQTVGFQWVSSGFPVGSGLPVGPHQNQNITNAGFGGIHQLPTTTTSDPPQPEWKNIVLFKWSTLPSAVWPSAMQTLHVTFNRFAHNTHINFYQHPPHHHLCHCLMIKHCLSLPPSYQALWF